MSFKFLTNSAVIREWIPYDFNPLKPSETCFAGQPMVCACLKRTCMVPGYAFHTCPLHQVDTVKILHIFFFSLTGVKRSELKSAHMIVGLCISPSNCVRFCCLFLWGDAHDSLRRERELSYQRPCSAARTWSGPDRRAQSPLVLL